MAIFTASRLEAVPSLYPELLPQDHPPVCRVNTAETQVRMKALRASPNYAAPISASTYSVIVVRFDFSDQVMTKTQAQADSFMASVKAFYLENSYGKMSVNGTTTGNGAGGQGAYRMPRTMAYYASGLNSKYAELARDAVALTTTSGVSLSTYTHIMFYHAGEGAETATSPSSYIWSAYAPSSFLSGPTIGSKVFPGGTFVPEKEFVSVDPLGVLVHEYGHQLGLPDLYNAETGSSKVGSWSLMDSGVYIGSPQGSNPAHFDAWSKLFLGFSSPETVTFSENTVKTLTQAETSRTSFIRLPIAVSSVGEGNEFFLLEYRRTSGATYDTGLRGQGLLIWHIDDSIASNSTRLDNNNVNNGIPNLGVDLVESGSNDTAATGGSSADPWPGASVTFQSPKNNAFNGKDSGVIISDISSAGSASISLTLRTTLSNPAITANTTPGSVVVTGGSAGYFNPTKGESTLIGIRPLNSGSVTVKVYSLNGDLIKESSVSGTAGQTTTVAWDGKNTDGKSASSGIYLIHINGGGIDIKKKAALIR